MINQSKKNDPRFKRIWKNSGATGTIADAVERRAKAYDELAYAKFSELVQENRANIDAMGINYENGLTTLSIGEDRINEWAYQPAGYLVVPNNDSLECGQNLTSLPRGAVSVERVYGVRDKSKSLFRQTKAPIRGYTNQPKKSYADPPKNRQLSIQGDKTGGQNYVQTNKHGYITGVVKEGLLVGLHGGTKSTIVNDKQAADITKLLKVSHKRGEGLHIDELCIDPIARFNSKN